MIKLLRFIWHLPRNLIIGLIAIYQITLSPDHSFWAKWVFPHGYCRYYPTCSSYGKQSLEKYGLLKGLPKTIWRILRCNPWSKGGKDLP